MCKISIPLLSNYAFITLGCNIDKGIHIPYVLNLLADKVVICGQTPLMTTEPIDFPYPSDDFANIAFVVKTSLSQQEFCDFLHQLEQDCGRNEENSRLYPEFVPMDLDLILWNESLVKPRDLSRGYVQDGLAYFGIKIDKLDDFYKCL